MGIFKKIGHGVEHLGKSIFNYLIVGIRKILVKILQKLHIISIMNKTLEITLDCLVISGLIYFTTQAIKNYKVYTKTAQLESVSKKMTDIMTVEKFFSPLSKA